jgi:hypothetical protein
MSGNPLGLKVMATNFGPIQSQAPQERFTCLVTEGKELQLIQAKNASWWLFLQKIIMLESCTIFLPNGELNGNAPINKRPENLADCDWISAPHPVPMALAP